MKRNAGFGMGVPSPILNRENGINSERQCVVSVRSDVQCMQGVKGVCLLLFCHSLISKLTLRGLVQI